MTKNGKRQFQALTIVLFFLCSAFLFPLTVTAAEEVKEVALDFDDVDIRLFIRVISELTGKNFVVDNNVRGKVTVLSPKKLTTSQAYEVFKSVLNVNGFTVVEAGEVSKVIPAQNMSGYEVPLSTGKVLRGEDQFITQIMPPNLAFPPTTAPPASVLGTASAVAALAAAPVMVGVVTALVTSPPILDLWVSVRILTMSSALAFSR